MLITNIAMIDILKLFSFVVHTRTSDSRTTTCYNNPGEVCKIVAGWTLPSFHMFSKSTQTVMDVVSTRLLQVGLLQGGLLQVGLLQVGLLQVGLLPNRY